MIRQAAALLVLSALACGPLVAGDAGPVWTLHGMGLGQGYKGGGKLKLTDVSLSDQVVHFSGEAAIPLRMRIGYEVLETAPVLLNSRMGTEYWAIANYTRGEELRLYTTEDIDLRKRGKAVARVSRARLAGGEGRGKGLIGIRSHYLVLIDSPGDVRKRRWIDTSRPPAVLQDPEFLKHLTFTLADLSDYKLAIKEAASAWQAGGPFRVKIAVTGADAKTFPVVGAQVVAEAPGWRAPLHTERDDVLAPTGWMACRLPAGKVPGRVDVTATVKAMTPGGPETRVVKATFPKGRGLTPARPPPKAPAFPRTADGKARETRALWVHAKDYRTAADVKKLLARARTARLNVLLPIVYVRAMSLVRSDRYPLVPPPKPDALAALIEAAHAIGLEVHPWFCVAYKTAASVKAFAPGAALVNKDGTAEKHRMDLHRPAYRDFIVGLMADVAKRYDVDGIHLDYIRTMGTCYCDDCRTEYKQRFHKPLPQAGRDELVAWHASAVGDIVSRTAKGVRAAKPKAVLSVAVFSRLGAPEQGQVPLDWARRGWVDLVIPMDYSRDPLSVRLHERAWLKALGDRAGLLTSGLSLYTHHGGEAVTRRVDAVRRQIGIVRKLGIRGYCLFVSGHLTEEMARMLREANREDAVAYYRGRSARGVRAPQ